MIRRSIFVLAIATTLALARPAAAGVEIDAPAELAKLAQGQPVPRHIGEAGHRLAIFTYEDPDGTGLGDLVAGLIAQHILSGGYVRSLGVIRYTGRLTPGPGERGLSYFDRVDRLAAAQAVELSLWGSIRKTPGALRIDTFLQIHDAGKLGLTWEQPITGCADAVLRASVRPTRILLERLDLGVAEAAALAGEVGELDRIHAEPSVTAPVVCTIQHDQVVSYRAVQNGWALVLGCNRGGWVNVQPDCGRGCRLLAIAATFAGELLGSKEHASPPLARAGLSTEALAVAEGIALLRSVKVRDSAGGLAIAERWIGPGRLVDRDPDTGIDRGRGTPPGGAAFANARMCLNIVGTQRGPALPPVPKAQLLAEAEKLAEALQLDPLNADVLHNLEVLFRCAGDLERAERAKALPRR